MAEIANRKNDHLDFVLNSKSDDISFFDMYRLEHTALPEINFADIDTHIDFLGRRLNFPLLIDSISGGTDRAGKLNRELAEIAQDFNIGLCVGSQRIALEDSSRQDSFKVRKYAPNILLLANFGAVQLNYGYGIDECRRAVDMIEADALILHLNPLQEAFQTTGNTNFENLLPRIEQIKKSLPVPLIVKEVGSGISLSVAKKLADVGIDVINVAGLGSISWAEIEGSRSNSPIIKRAASVFKNWGIPTIECVKSISAGLPNMPIIASGGIRNGLDVAKSIASGASVCGMASCILKKVYKNADECKEFIKELSLELKIAMFCTGCKTIDDLKNAKITQIS